MPGQPRAPQAPASGELARIAAAMGVDLSTLGGGGSGVAVDPKDPPVYFGAGGTPEYRADGDVLRHRGGKKQGGRSETIKSLSEANAAFYEMQEQEVAALQRRLVAAGILDPKSVRYGDYDDDTYSAFAAINERAAKFNAVGKKVTPSDVLGMIERTAGAVEGVEEEIEPGRVARTTSAATLEEQVQAAAQRELGRKLRPKEASKFAALYRSMETGFIAKEGAMEDDAALTGMDASLEAIPDSGVAAEQFIDSDFAQEAAGQDAYGYLGALRSMLES